MKKEVIYEEGRKGDELSTLCERFFNQVNEYNDKHQDQAHVVVLACDSKGGASFCIGDTDVQVKELFESAERHEAFLDLLKRILDEFRR